MKKRENPLEALQRAQGKSSARRKRLLERLKARQASKKRSTTVQKSEQAGRRRDADFHEPGVELAIAAARRLRLMTLDSDIGPPTPLNRPTVAILREFLRTLATGESALVLQWPLGQNDVSFLHPVAMLGLICAPVKRTTGEYDWCEAPHTFRTLYFPWRGGATGASQASLLVHRKEVVSWNRYHLTRSIVQSDRSDSLVDGLHKTLVHLNALSDRDTSKPHLAHPTLSEVYPVFVADHGGESPHFFEDAIGRLFGRVQYGAALHKFSDHRASISRSHSAPYGFFGVSPRVSFSQALAAPALSSTSGLPPDICLLDLGSSVLSSLGATWSEVVEEFITETNKRFPNLPFLVITQDTYTHGRITKTFRKTLSLKVPRSRVIVRVSSDPLAIDPSLEQVSDTEVKFTTVSGSSVDALTALTEAARGSSDPTLAGTLRREMGSLRKAASLPCGLAPAYDFLCQEIGQVAAETFLEYRSGGTLLAPLEDALAAELGGAERARLVKARDAVRIAFDNLDAETPIGSLLADLAKTVLSKSSSTVIAFASEIDLRLGANRLVDDSDVGRAMRKRLDKAQIILTSAEDLDSRLADIESTRDRKDWKRLVLIAPNLGWLSRATARTWIPEELIVVCERTLAARVADVFRRLSFHPDLGGEGYLGARLVTIAEAAKVEVEARDVGSVDLHLDPRTDSSGTETIIDLTDEDSDDDGEVCELTLSSGRTLRARSGAVVVRYDHNAAINPFETTRARDISKGDSVVVPDEAFIEEARDLLPLRVLAQNWVDVYHATIEAHLAGIPGNTLSAKARKVLADIQAKGARTQSHAAVLGWLKVEEYREEPPETRQPHAPQRRSEFEAFMAVLGVNDAVAEKMWSEGIQPLRIDRRRAGQKTAQAFVSVLVDPHGTATGFSAPVRHGIGALRKKALDHLDQVIGVETINMGGKS